MKYFFWKSKLHMIASNKLRCCSQFKNKTICLLFAKLFHHLCMCLKENISIFAPNISRHKIEALWERHSYAKFWAFQRQLHYTKVSGCLCMHLRSVIRSQIRLQKLTFQHLYLKRTTLTVLSECTHSPVLYVTYSQA